MSPLVTGVVGTVVGAAAGVTATFVLADEKTRKKVGAMLTDMSKRAVARIKEVNKQSGKIREEAGQRLGSVVSALKKSAKL